MSSTNKTTNYELSQYVGSDKPTYLGDYNGDMLKIDTQMKANATAIASSEAQIETALTNSSTALTNANTAQTTATTAQTSAESAQTTANTALSKANANETLITNINNRVTPTTLYDNQTGSSSSVTLSESVTNFDYLEVFYAGVQGNVYYYSSTKIDVPNNKTISLLSAISGASNFYFVGADALISGTSITLSNNRRVWFYHNSNAYFDTDSLIYVTKVLGYKA